MVTFYGENVLWFSLWCPTTALPQLCDSRRLLKATCRLPADRSCSCSSGSLLVTVSLRARTLFIMRGHWTIFERSEIKRCYPPSTKIYFFLTLHKRLGKNNWPSPAKCFFNSQYFSLMKECYNNIFCSIWSLFFNSFGLCTHFYHYNIQQLCK